MPLSWRANRTKNRPHMSGRPSTAEQDLTRAALARPRSRDLGSLRALSPFLRPYRMRVIFGGLALVGAAMATLILPMAVGSMIDHGFSAENASFIDSYFYALLGVAALMAAASAVRFYYVTWIGERVVADIRRAVYAHVLSLSPRFFEVTRTGEVLSRLTADTTLIQTVVGSSLSMAMRNIITIIGGSILLALTSLELTGLALLVVPAIVVPLIVFGRRVRGLSRAAQDRMDRLVAWHHLHTNIMQFTSTLPLGQTMRIKGEDVLTYPQIYLPQIAEWMGIRTDSEAIDCMMHPERSPFAAVGPDLARGGNDPKFLRSPALRGKPVREPSLAKFIDEKMPAWFPSGLLSDAAQRAGLKVKSDEDVAESLAACAHELGYL